MMRHIHNSNNKHKVVGITVYEQKRAKLNPQLHISYVVTKDRIHTYVAIHAILRILTLVA